MPRGHVTALFLFDIADAIDLDAVRRLVTTATAPLSTKPPAPAYLQYAQPPIVIDGAAIGATEVHGFRVRFKTFDYGVISVALTRPLSASWPALEGVVISAQVHSPLCVSMPSFKPRACT